MCHDPPRSLHIPSITTSNVRWTRLIHGLHSSTSECAGKSIAGVPEYLHPPHFLAVRMRRVGAARFNREHGFCRIRRPTRIISSSHGTPVALLSKSRQSINCKQTPQPHLHSYIHFPLFKPLKLQTARIHTDSSQVNLVSDPRVSCD
jgi:hypothetical protein